MLRRVDLETLCLEHEYTIKRICDSAMDGDVSGETLDLIARMLGMTDLEIAQADSWYAVFNWIKEAIRKGQGYGR